MLDQVDRAPDAGGDHPNAVPRPMQHDRTERSQVFGAHLSKLRQYHDDVRPPRVTARHALIQLFAHQHERLERGLLVVRVNRGLKDVQHTEQFVRQGTGTVENHQTELCWRTTGYDRGHKRTEDRLRSLPHWRRDEDVAESVPIGRKDLTIGKHTERHEHRRRGPRLQISIEFGVGRLISSPSQPHQYISVARDHSLDVGSGAEGSSGRVWQAANHLGAGGHRHLLQHKRRRRAPVADARYRGAFCWRLACTLATLARQFVAHGTRQTRNDQTRS